MDGIAFSKKTFTYFDGARRNVGDAAWFEAHRGLYAEHVELPLTHLVMELDRALSPLLPESSFRRASCRSRCCGGRKMRLVRR